MLLSTIVIVLSLVSGLLLLWRIPLARPVSQPHPGQGPMPEQDTQSISGLKVTVIVPARNEARRLPPLLASIKQQDFVPHEFIVVDDQSTDDTALIARSSGATVIPAMDPGEGWIGKSRACWTGAQAATGDWLLFLDADTRLTSPDSLSRILLSFRDAGGRGSLSLQPYHTVVRLYENLSAIFNIIVMAGMSVFTPLGDKLKSAGLFGPCLICQRTDYFAVGGHEAIRGSVMDDLSLGQSFLEAGLPVHCLGGRGVISFRMYPEGIGQLFEGWTKNFGSASTLTHPLVFLLIIIWICGGFSLITLLIRVMSLSSTGYLLFAVFAYLAYAGLMIHLARKTGNFKLPLLLLFPVLLVFFALTFFWSLYLTRIRRTVHWRGRQIRT